MQRLHGKYLLLTGASQGLGRQLASDFARAGAAGLALVARTTTAPFAFTLPPELAAKEPPEHRGMGRDQVRLMVIDRTTYQLIL